MAHIIVCDHLPLPPRILAKACHWETSTLSGGLAGRSCIDAFAVANRDAT
jgi:hypothetical protein